VIFGSLITALLCGGTFTILVGVFTLQDRMIDTLTPAEVLFNRELTRRGYLLIASGVLHLVALLTILALLRR
jgi:hypothetical protein